jgi:CHAD domain-containing protein
LLARGWTDELRTELGWLGSALGPVRDLDVLLHHLRVELAPLIEDGGLTGLVESLEAERQRARDSALAALGDERYLRLLDRLECEAESPPPSGSTGKSLRALWSSELRRLRRTFGRLDHGSADAELHAARIRVKRSRYAAELALHELGAPGKRFVDEAKRLQDVLGEHQDACVVSERVTAWADGGDGENETTKRLLARETARRRRARAAWPKAWMRVERAGRPARQR